MSILKSIKMPLNYSYKMAQVFALFIASVLFLLSFTFGRVPLFLWLNGNLGAFADTFFSYFTHLAEGWILIPYVILIVAVFKKDLLFISINFIISTLLTQIPKQLIWPNVNRPIASGIDIYKIHTVKGIDVHSFNSFPSGHTATAFSLFLVTVYLFPNKNIFLVGIFYAIVSGYSRIYLGQHFPLDIAGGITAALLSVPISIQIRKKLFKKPF